jgi:hypothetical protein
MMGSIFSSATDVYVKLGEGDAKIDYVIDYTKYEAFLIDLKHYSSSWKTSNIHRVLMLEIGLMESVYLQWKAMSRR